MMAPELDKTYQEASAVAIGRTIAEIFRGMVEGGLDRAAAERILIAYVQALAMKPSDPA